jgi:hypothetical protein
MKLNEVAGKEKYPAEISNRFTALENVDTEADINRSLWFDATVVSWHLNCWLRFDKTVMSSRRPNY